MGRHDPPKRPYQCEPKHCYNTEDCILNLSGLINTRMYRKRIKHQSRRQSHYNSPCPAWCIQYRQEEHWSALIQINQDATYYVESVQSISVYCY